MTDLFMRPKVDIVFKRIFGDERNKSILISFLSAVLNMNKADLYDLTIVNNELLPEYNEDKQSILDIKIRLKNNTLINVEIQILAYQNMVDRIIYYLTRMYNSEIKKGDKYQK